MMDFHGTGNCHELEIVMIIWILIECCPSPKVLSEDEKLQREIRFELKKNNSLIFYI